MTPQESEVENPLLETNVTEIPIFNYELNNTDPVEIDSFFINNLNLNNLDVVLEESLTHDASILKFCDDENIHVKSHLFQAPIDVTNKQTVLSKNNDIDLNGEKLIDDEPIPIVIGDLCNVNKTLLEANFGNEAIESNLRGSLDDDESSMLYGDLPSVSQVFDESNIDYIESLATNNNIDDATSQEGNIPNTSQEAIIEFIDLVVTKKNDIDMNIEQAEEEAKVDSSEDPQEMTEILTSDLNSQENGIKLSDTTEDLLINESVSILPLCASEEIFDANLEQSDPYLLNKNESKPSKVKVTTKNQIAPNIHSVLPTTSEEYFETAPDSNIGDIDSEDSLNQLEMEQADVKGVKLKVPHIEPQTRVKGPKRIRNRRKYPFNKRVQPSPCHKKCGNGCSSRLSEIDRLVIHERYWQMNKQKQQDWLLTCIRPKKIRRRQGSTTVKNVSYDYYITHEGEEIKVCQQFLMKTLDISQMRFRYAISKHKAAEDKYSDTDDSDQSQES